MPSSVSRRRFLAVSTSLAGLAGCLGTSTSGPDSTEKPTASPTSTTRTTEPTEGTRTDDVYVRNTDRDVEFVSIRLVRTDGENPTVLDNRYRFPHPTQMVIPDVGAEGATYEIIVSLDGGEMATATWKVGSCEGTPAPDGNYDLEVQIDDGEAVVVSNGCDEIMVSSRNPFDHTEFLIEETEAGDD